MSLDDKANDFLNCAPEPLRAPMPKGELYPVEELGKVLGDAVKALQQTIKAPMALCAQSVLASASLAVQAHYDIQLPWGETKPLSLFLLTIAESGERKSGVDDVVLGAAKKHERACMETYDAELTRYEQDLAEWKAKNEAANRKAGNAKTQAASDEAASELTPKPEAPIVPLRFVTDPTVEGLYKLLAISQPSVGLFTDEGGLFVGGNAMNSDNALKTMARLCKFWDGSPFDRVRAGDGAGVLYGRRLSLHLLAQPDVMQKILGDRMANSQGFLARCLTAWPESTIGTRYISDDGYANPCESKQIKRLFKKLLDLTEAIPRTGRTEQVLDPRPLPLSNEAKDLAIKAGNAFETQMSTGKDLEEIRDRAGKAVENACRIAGVMAVVEDGLATREISKDHLERGFILIQWYLKEALRIRGAALIPQEIIDAESLSKWLYNQGIKLFGTSMIIGKCPNAIRNKTRLDGAIKVLTDNGYLRLNDTGTTINGKKVKRSWEVLHVVQS